MAVKTWFITGTSRGFGREWASAALDRGDMVAATARDIASLDDLAAKYGDAILPIRLDVTDRRGARPAAAPGRRLVPADLGRRARVQAARLPGSAGRGDRHLLPAATRRAVALARGPLGRAVAVARRRPADPAGRRDRRQSGR